MDIFHISSNGTTPKKYYAKLFSSGGNDYHFPDRCQFNTCNHQHKRYHLFLTNLLMLALEFIFLEKSSYWLMLMLILMLILMMTPAQTYAADIFFGQEWNDHRLRLAPHHHHRHHRHHHHRQHLSDHQHWYWPAASVIIIII